MSTDFAGGQLAEVILQLGVERVVLQVYGVPIPDWAVRVFEELRAAVGNVLPVDLLGVDGYRWESWRLRSQAVA